MPMRHRPKHLSSKLKRGEGATPPPRRRTMPLYEYEHCGQRFEQWHRIENRHDALCPVCQGIPSIRISLSAVRFAEPVTIYQDLGGYGDRHRGYQQIGWKPDSGISHKPGEPYKTTEQFAREEEESRASLLEV